jgi:hypothetical protein
MHKHIFLFSLLIIFGSIIEAAPLFPGEADLRRKLEKLERSLLEKKEALDLQEAIANSLRGELEKQSKLANDLQNRLDTTHKSLQQKNKKLEILEAEAQSHTNQSEEISRLKREIQSHTNQSEEISRLKREIDLLKEEISRLKDERFGLIQQVRSLQSENRISQQRVATRDAALRNQHGTGIIEYLRNMERRAEDAEAEKKIWQNMFILSLVVIPLTICSITKIKFSSKK